MAISIIVYTNLLSSVNLRNLSPFLLHFDKDGLSFCMTFRRH